MSSVQESVDSHLLLSYAALRGLLELVGEEVGTMGDDDQGNLNKACNKLKEAAIGLEDVRKKLREASHHLKANSVIESLRMQQADV